MYLSRQSVWKKYFFDGRNLDPRTFQFRRHGAVQPFLVEDGDRLFYPAEGQAEVHLPGAKDEGLILPPALLGQIDISFVGIAAYLFDIMRFAGTRRPCYHQLQKFKTDGQIDAANVLQLFDRLQDFFEGIGHG